ncbi:mechanosensitive ion channel family protein [Allocoleopsis sp.]|uniref:mechanosensitive ion channel family protein n=1 Tax=Allocoleopsis sp. TaxID=3088169 RepID=UPI002FCF8AF4
MKIYWRSLIGLALATVLLVTAPTLARSQENATSSSSSQEAAVILGNQTLFTIQEGFGSTSPEQRSQEITEKVESLAQDSSIPVESIQLGDQNGVTVIFSGETVIAQITDADAKAANTTPRELANAYIQKLKNAISQYRNESGFSGDAVEVGIWQWFKEALQNASSLTSPGARFSYTHAISYTLISTVILIIFLFLVHQIFTRISAELHSQRNAERLALRVGNSQLLSSRHVSDILLKILKAIRSFSNLVVISIYTVLVLSFFPWTRRFGLSLWSQFVSAFNQAWIGFANYSPKIFNIIIVFIVTYYVIRFLKLIFNELKKGTISLPGFYPEWAEPTYNLLKVLVLAIAGIISFPYLPGFGSPSFQGISVFMGLLISLGSSAAIANMVSGIILIYTRAFQIGDRIEIVDLRRDVIRGDVEEKSLLVTRIRTSLNVIVTLPNAGLLASNIKNYSASFRDSQKPVLLSTTVDFSYDVPWQKIYEILTEAALLTRGVLEEPAAKIYQKKLNNFSVTYEVRLYTTQPQGDSSIFSEFNKNIRDKCIAAGIEILSPHYSAVRDGNMSTLPEEALPKNYSPRGFQLHSLGNLFQVDLTWGSNGKNGKNGKQITTPNTPSGEQASKQDRNSN